MKPEDFKTTSTLKELSQNSSFSTREKHLIGLAVTLTKGCSICTKRRFEEAHKSGISKDELIALSDIVALTNAGVVIRTAMSSFNGLADSCTNDICSIH